MYDELISALRNNADHYGYEAEDGLVHLLTNAADAIEELSKLVGESIPKADAEIIIAEVAKPRWIPVTERLPKDAGVYLCRIKSFSHEFRYTDTMKYVDGFFYEQGAVTDRVTHWMPLPEPPKEE